MCDLDLDAVGTNQALGEAFGEVDGPVVPPVATKGDLQEVAPILEIHLDRLAYKRLSRIKETVHLRLVPLKKINHRLVESGITAQGRVIVWVGHQPAVKDEPTPVIVIGILGYTIGIGERNN